MNLFYANGRRINSINYILFTQQTQIVVMKEIESIDRIEKKSTDRKMSCT